MMKVRQMMILSADRYLERNIGDDDNVYMYNDDDEGELVVLTVMINCDLYNGNDAYYDDYEEEDDVKKKTITLMMMIKERRRRL